MKSERWNRLKGLLADALELPVDQRLDFARKRVGDDPEFLKELEDLIVIEEDLDDFLMPPAGHAIPLDKLQAEAENMPPLESIGEFQLLRELGRGGRGVVYLARHAKTEKLVAVKVLSLSVLPSAVAVERFRREARAAAKLEHPAIVKITDIDHDLGRPYLVMEHVDGRSLGDELSIVRELLDHSGEQDASSSLMPDGPESLPSAAAELVKKLAEALHHAHDNGIVHRDVKPQNILIDTEGEPHLVDFGLARDEAEVTLTKEGEVEGTPNYMSPEQVRAQRDQIDRRTDIYSLGVVLYEMLTLRRPFDAPTARQVMHNITRRLPERVRRLNASIPTSLETICQKAMAKRRRDRYETAQEFAQDLGRFLTRQAILARAPGPVLRAVRTVQRNPAPWLSSAAAIVLISATSWVVNRQAPDIETIIQSQQPSVELRLQPGALAVGAEIFLRSLDPKTESWNEAVSVGTYPLDADIPLEPNTQYRLSAKALSGEIAESTLLEQQGAFKWQRLMTLQDPDDHEGMLMIPPGSIHEQNYLEDELSDREIHLAPYYVDEFLVSVGDYKNYLDETGLPYPSSWTPEYLAHPKALKISMTNISLHDAVEYCAWRGGRLMTLAEWQYAVAGVDNLRYPTGLSAESSFDGFSIGLNFVETTGSSLVENTSQINEWLLENFATRDDLHPLDFGGFGMAMVFGHVAEMTSSIVPQKGMFYYTSGPSLVSKLSRVKRAGFTFVGGVPALLADPIYGFRCAVSADPLL